MPDDTEHDAEQAGAAEEEQTAPQQPIIIITDLAEDEKRDNMDEAGTSSSHSKQLGHPTSPASMGGFASPTRPAPPAPSPFARPASFPSESWPEPPLRELQAPGGIAAVAAQLEASGGGSADRFARWVVSTGVETYVGDRMRGLYHGRGRATFKAGQTYDGEWSEGLMHGEGVYTWADGCVYTGQMCHQAVTGRGRLLWPDGATYEGGVLDGFRHGEGVFIDPSVPCMYEGQWEHGLRHGAGKLTYDDAGSNYYEGQWERGARHGYGLLRYASGNLYEGEWVWDRKVGKGTMSWFTSNQRYEGQWLNDRPHGRGEYTWLDLPVAGLQGQALAQQQQQLSVTQRAVAAAAGARAAAQLLTHFQHHNRFVGEWVQGVREGRGTFFYSNGAVYDGDWQGDRKHGQGRFVFANGSQYEGAFEHDQMADGQRWKNPYTGVADQMQAQSQTQSLSMSLTQPLGGKTGRGKEVSTTVKDVGMFDLPLDDLLAAHALDMGLRAGTNASDSFVAGQRDQIANLLLRFNTELLDIYRYYAHAEVDIAQPELEAPVLPYTPLSPTSALSGAVHPSASASAVSSRMNLAQLWLLVSDLGLIGHPALAHADLTLAALDRLVLRRMLLGGSDAHANRLLLPSLNSVHDPRNVLLLRDFLEALVRLAEELFRAQPQDQDQAGEEEEEIREEIARTSPGASDTEEEEDVAADNDDADGVVAPTVLYARALGSFDQILTSSSGAPLPGHSSELSPLPLHELSSLSISSPSAAGSHSASRSLFNSASVLSNPGAPMSPTAASRTYGSTVTLPSLNGTGAAAMQNTVAHRLKRFLVEFVLPRAKTRSKHAFNALGLSAAGGSFASGGGGGGSAHHHQQQLSTQPLYRLPSIVVLVKKYEKEIYTRIFLPHSTQHAPLPSAAAAALAKDSLVATLPPLVDRTISLASVLRVLQSHSDSNSAGGAGGGGGVLGSYFTLYHVLDVLFGPSPLGHGEQRLFQAMDLELLFEELLDTLVRVALYRGKVLREAAESVARERAALQRIRDERREAAEAEARRVAAIKAAAAEVAAAAAAALAAETDNKSLKGGKPAAATSKVGSGASSAAPSKPTSAGKKPSLAGTGAAAAAAASSSAAAKAAPKGSRAPSAGKKDSAAPTPRSGSLKKDASGKTATTAAANSSKPGSAKKKPQGSIRPASGASAGAGVGTGVAFASSSSSLSGVAGGVGGFPSRAPVEPSSPYGSAPNSSRAGLGGGESGSLRKRRDSNNLAAASPHSATGLDGVIHEWERFGLQDGGGADSSLHEHQVERWCADTEAFFCTLLARPLPPGLQPSFPAEIVEVAADEAI